MDILQSKKEIIREHLRVKFFAAGNPTGPVLILGLGVHGGGLGAARFFARLGLPVIVSDLKPAKDLQKSLQQLKKFKNITYIFGRHPLKEIESASLIVKNPGVPESSPSVLHAKTHHIPITNDGALFLELAPREKIIGITGTKGKTTTTLLITHMLGKTAIAIGTPGSSFFDYFNLKKEPRWIVAEFSSFDLEYNTSSPHISVITSLFADHLNRYSSFASYAHAKMNIIKYQKTNDMAFLWDSTTMKKYILPAQSKIVWVSGAPNIKAASWRVAPEAITLATQIGDSLGLSKSTIKSRLHTFDAPTGRLEIVAKKRGRIFINDTTATNPGAAIHSIEMLNANFDITHPIAIITGGEDKIFPLKDVKEFAKKIHSLKIHPVLIPGSFTDMLRPFLTQYTDTKTIDEAVTEAASTASIIALVPGAASFNMFKNEFDRGNKFIQAVHALKV